MLLSQLSDQCEAHPAKGCGEDALEDAQVLDGVAALALPPAPGGLLVGGGTPGLSTPSTPLHTRSYSAKWVSGNLRRATIFVIAVST
jgi:hypothetical protein